MYTIISLYKFFKHFKDKNYLRYTRRLTKLNYFSKIYWWSMHSKPPSPQKKTFPNIPDAI